MQIIKEVLNVLITRSTLVIIICCYIPIVLAKDNDDRVVEIEQQDETMNLAIERARETLDEFLELLKNPPTGATGFKLKVMVSDENGTEHLWFSPIKEYQGGFAGVLSNEPMIVRSVVWGEAYTFEQDQISDWGYSLGGKQFGSFTVCAMFTKMAEEEVEYYKKEHGFRCEPQSD